MDAPGPDWKGLLKWSIANSDGTQAPREVRYVEFFISVIWCSICSEFRGVCDAPRILIWFT